MFTTMSWNVEKLFAPAPADRDAFDAALDAIAGILTAETPDLVGMQEIGDEDAFAALLDRLGGDWAEVLSTHFGLRHPIRVGWLSRRPLERDRGSAGVPEQYRPGPCQRSRRCQGDERHRRGERERRDTEAGGGLHGREDGQSEERRHGRSAAAPESKTDDQLLLTPEEAAHVLRWATHQRELPAFDPHDVQVTTPRPAPRGREGHPARSTGRLERHLEGDGPGGQRDRMAGPQSSRRQRNSWTRRRPSTSTGGGCSPRSPSSKR